MSDNVIVNAVSTGPTVRAVNKAGVETQVVVLDLGGSGAESLLSGPLPVSLAAVPLPTGAAQDGTDITSPTAMPAGGSGIRGWLSAIWTKLNGSLAVTGTVAVSNAGFAVVGNVEVTNDAGNPLPVSGVVAANAGTNLNTSALALETGGNLAAIAGKDFATQTTLATLLTTSDFDSKSGSLTETAPATDTASSGLNGRLQRVAQRLTSLIALLPGSLGSKTSANSLPVVIASDQAAVTVTEAPNTGSGLSTYRLLSAATTNAASVKASAGQLYGWHITNTNAAARYVKFYNKASAPTVGTDTPVLTVLIPGNTAGAGAAVSLPSGVKFTTGIALAITGAVADADTTTVAANEVIVNLFYF